MESMSKFVASSRAPVIAWYTLLLCGIAELLYVVLDAGQGTYPT